MTHVCNFPKLPDKYDRALREAASFVLERFKPVAIIAAGTIVRGTPDALEHNSPAFHAYTPSMLAFSRTIVYVSPTARHDSGLRWTPRRLPSVLRAISC